MEIDFEIGQVVYVIRKDCSIVKVIIERIEISESFTEIVFKGNIDNIRRKHETFKTFDLAKIAIIEKYSDDISEISKKIIEISKLKEI